MTDRELLEFAAHAAGYWVCNPLRYDEFRVCLPEQHHLSFAWNPLIDDGDALRLAVKLGICLGPNFDGDLAVCFSADGNNITEPYGKDSLAATRRAIVRAAAEIGRGMS